MKQICENHYDKFDVELTNNLVQFATNEMIKSSDSQFPASDILITLGRGRSDQVIYIYLYIKFKQCVPSYCSLFTVKSQLNSCKL